MQTSHWLDIYHLAKNYYDYYGYLIMPIHFKTKDGINYDSEGIDLYGWLHNSLVIGFDEEREQLLYDIGYINEKIICKSTWKLYYGLLKNYYNKYGNTDLPKDYRTLDGITYNKKGKNLFAWFNYQKYLLDNNKLSKDNLGDLENIGIKFKKDIYAVFFEENFSIIKANYLKEIGYNYSVWQVEKAKKTIDELYINHKLNEKEIEMLNNINYFNKENNWQECYDLAKKFYDENGHLNLSKDYTIDDVNLDKWLKYQIKCYHSFKLSPDKYQKLLAIGAILETKNNRRAWNEYFELLKNYYNFYHNLDIPKSFKTFDGIHYDENGKSLFSWFDLQKKLLQKDSMSEERESLLCGLCSIELLTTKIDPWEKNYALARIYANEYHHLNTPKNFKTLDGINYDSNGFNLNNWLNIQKRNYQSGDLSQDKYQKLRSIGFIFEDLRVNDNFEKYYDLAKKYYEYHHNLDMPLFFKTIDGYTYNENGDNLASFLAIINDLNNEAKLSYTNYMRFIDLHYIFTKDCNDLTWLNNFKIFKNYYEHYHNPYINNNFKTLDGINYDENGLNLNRWLDTQKRLYENNKLSISQIKMFESINYSFDKTSYNYGYELAKKFYEHYHHLVIPDNFKTIDGYTYNENGFNLSNWLNGTINNARYWKTDYLMCSKLEELGIDVNFNIKEYKWEFMYSLIYASYQNIQDINHISEKFNTLDGTTYN